MRAEATGTMRLATLAPAPARVNLPEDGFGSSRASARREPVSVVRPDPLVVVQVVSETDRRERKPEVVEDDVQAVAPPRVPLHPEVVQDDLEVEADLETDLTLAQRGRTGRVALHVVRDREHQIAKRPDLEVEAVEHSGQMQVRRVDLVRVIAAEPLRLAARLAALQR